MVIRPPTAVHVQETVLHLNVIRQNEESNSAIVFLRSVCDGVRHRMTW